MASLTTTAITARRAIRYSIYGLVILLIGRVILASAVGIFLTIFPKAPPPPTTLFGKLPIIKFPTNKIDPATLTYRLETPDGKLPVLSTQSNVYFIKKELSTLFSVQEGLKKGVALGFTNPGQEVTETLYRFKHQDLPKTLEINVVSNIFSLSYDLSLDPSPIDALPPSPEVAASLARSYLSSANLLPDDLTGEISHEYLRVKEGKLVPVPSLSEAHLTKVSLHRTPYEKLPSLGPNPDQANVWFLVSGSKTAEKRILAGEFHYFPVEVDKVSTYPIKTSEEAWAELINGRSYLAKSPTEGQVVVRNVYLANYDPGEFESYFQPIYVFEGEDFLAYIPAVTSEYYGE